MLPQVFSKLFSGGVTTSTIPSTLTWFYLRREPYYHKLQYSKTPKFDVAAAVVGVVISAFVGYMALSSFGSAGADLTDMGVLFWYTFLVYRTYWLLFFLCKNSVNFFFNPVICIFWVLYYTLLSACTSLRSLVFSGYRQF